MRNPCASRVSLTSTALFVASSIACAPAVHTRTNDAQSVPDRGVFAVVRGGDTIAVETFERRTDVLTDVLTGNVKAPGRPWIRYRMELGAGGRPEKIAIAVFPAGQDTEANPLQQVNATVVGDSVKIAVSNPTGSTSQQVSLGRDTWLIVGQSSAELEHLLATVRRENQDSAAASVYPLLGGRLTPLGVRYFGADSAAVTLGQKSTAHFDKQGRLVRLVQGAGAIVATRTSAAITLSSAGVPTYDAPAGAPYTAEHVKLESNGKVMLAGTLTLPRATAQRPVPAVVMISGSGPQDRDSFLPLGTGYRPFRQFADTLGRRGIAVLRFDDRGTGASTGSFAAATEVDFVADVAAAVAFLRARPDIDPNRISLLGHSEGGVIGPLVAAQDPRIAALVLMAGPASPRSAVLEQNRRSIAAETTLSQARRDSLLQHVPVMLDSAANTGTWFGGFLRYDGRATAAKISVPVLILQGATDTQVPLEQAELYTRYFREGGNQRVTTVVFPHRNHLFLRDSIGDFARYNRLPSTQVDHEVLGVLADWLARVLLP